MKEEEVRYSDLSAMMCTKSRGIMVPQQHCQIRSHQRSAKAKYEMKELGLNSSVLYLSIGLHQMEYATQMDFTFEAETPSQYCIMVGKLIYLTLNTPTTYYACCRS